MKTLGEFDDLTLSRLKAAGRALLAFCLFPNLLFFLLSLFLFTNRAAVNLDYPALGALWLWIPPSLRVALFATLFVLDGIGSTAAMYNVHPFTGIVAVMKAPIGLIITVIIGAVITLGLAAGIGRFALRFLVDTRRRSLISAVMFGVIVLTLATDIAVGGNRYIGRRNGAWNVGSSGTLHFAWDLKDRIRSKTHGYPMAAASDSLRAVVSSGRIGNDNVLLVVVESMGMLRDPSLRARVLAPILADSVRARYDVRIGAIPFRGGTTSGELRELCGIFADYVTLPLAFLPQCLPRQLHDRGYKTIAIHGYTASYYNRSQWYPMLFDSSYFGASLALRLGLRRCGTLFRGICDRDAITIVGAALRAPDPRLVYWVTLDAHTPVDMDRQPEFRKLCDSPAEVCLEAAMWRDMFARLADLLTDPALPPTWVVIVGDHAPAFVLRDRAAAFVPHRVPYVELIPKSLWNAVQ